MSWYDMDADGNVRQLAEGQYPERGGHWHLHKETVRGYQVSTVFLGLDHAYLGGPPLLFETMVFPNESSYSELLCWRYRTGAEASAGHAAVVAALTAGQSPADLDQPDDAS